MSRSISERRLGAQVVGQAGVGMLQRIEGAMSCAGGTYASWISAEFPRFRVFSRVFVHASQRVRVEFCRHVGERDTPHSAMSDATSKIVKDRPSTLNEDSFTFPDVDSSLPDA